MAGARQSGGPERGAVAAWELYVEQCRRKAIEFTLSLMGAAPEHAERLVKIEEMQDHRGRVLVDMRLETPDGTAWDCLNDLLKKLTAQSYNGEPAPFQFELSRFLKALLASRLPE